LPYAFLILYTDRRASPRGHRKKERRKKDRKKEGKTGRKTERKKRERHNAKITEETRQ
jgi:hypothetical protein